MAVANRAATGKLPAESTSFVGRRRLLAEVKAAFANTRLLTLVGPGGVGSAEYERSRAGYMEASAILRGRKAGLN